MQRIIQRLRTVVLALAGLLMLVSLGTNTQAAGLGSGPDIAGGEPTAPAQTGDASLVAATFLGGSGTDYGRAVGLDAQGNIYLAGDLFSPSVLGRDLSRKGGQDIMVAKLSPDAKQLLGLFAIGGTGTDRVGGMAVTPQGEVVLSVETDNPSFPTKNAVHTAPIASNPGALLKINAALNDLVFSTFTTFHVSYEQHSVALDSAGNISVTGYLYNPTNRSRDLVLQRYSSDGQRLLFEKIWNGDARDEYAEALVVRPDGTTFIGGYTEGWINDLAVTGNAVQSICGRKKALGDDRDCDRDGFVFKLDPAGTVSYATYLGGNGGDEIVGLGVDDAGAMYVAGGTTAVDFPIAAGAFQPSCPTAKPEDGCYFDMFVSKIAPDGSRLEYSTYLASQDLGGLDYPRGIAVDGQGNASVVGFTASERWPTKNALQGALNAAPCPNSFQDRLCFDSVIATFTPDGQLAFSSYLGGSADELSTDIALGPGGNIYITGYSESLNYPTTAGVVQPSLSGGEEFFLARIGPRAGPTPPSPTPPSGILRTFIPLTAR